MLSIIILSSDGYSDCWNPLFISLKKYFSGIEKYEIILSTNTKKYSHPGLDIISLTNGIDTPWSKRLKISLDRAKNEIVLVIVEDFVLRSKIYKKVFNDFLSLMNKYEKIDHIRLLNNLKIMKIKHSEFNNLDEIDPKSKLRFTYSPGLWKKKALLKYVKDYESVFLSERLGGVRSWIYKDGFYTVSKEYIEKNGQFYDCAQSGMLFKGKWSHWVPPFFEKEGIKMDFSLRGLVTQEYRTKTRLKSKTEIFKNPISTLKSFLSILIIFLQSLILNFRK